MDDEISLTRVPPIRYYRLGLSQVVPYARGRTMGTRQDGSVS
jgi:hypothetical protein